MSQESLKEQLKALHEALNDAPDLDPESYNLLLKIAEDIEAVEVIEQPQITDLGDTLQEQIIQFDQDHPALSAILRQLTDTLGRIGI